MAADDLINQIKENLADQLAPINGGVGADCSFEDVDAIKNEIDKSASMGDAKTDWNVVANLADTALVEKTKDFRIGLYWAAARATQGGVMGLLEGFVLLNGLIEGFWDTMYPPLRRPKARGNLAGWLSDYCKTISSVSTFVPTSKDADLAKALEKVSRLVDNELGDKLGEAYGGMRELRNIIQNIERSVPKEAPPPPPPPPPTVSGMNTWLATASMMCRIRSRPSLVAVMSRKVSSSAPWSL